MTPLQPASGHEAADADTDAPDDHAGPANQFVTFAVAGELFAVPMAPVQEIIRAPEVARLPLAPASLDGLANLRGRVLPILNLRRLLGCEERASDDATRALVIRLGQEIGFVVDRVASVLTVEPSEIEPADSLQTIVDAAYLNGVIKRTRPDGGRDLLLCIDFARLIEGEFATSTGRGVDRPVGSVSDPLVQETGVDGLDVGSDDDLRLVSFTVEDQEYALDIGQVQEIVQLPEHINGVPNTASHVLGVMALRQRLLPLVCLRTLFGLPRLAYAEHHRIVVTSLPGGRSVGLVTDAVKEVLSVPRAQAEPVPSTLAASQSLEEFSSICRLDGGKRLVSIIVPERLLRLPAIEAALDATRAQGRSVHAHDEQEAAMNRNPLAIRTDADTTDDDMQVVVFRLGAEEFGVPIMSVQEIVRVPPTLTRVPRTPAFVEGVINLRGAVLPVIDQRSRLGLPAIERQERQRIMVFLLDGLRTGFIVDSVAEVLRIPRAHLLPAPTLSQEQSRLIRQVANLQGDRRMVMLIDPEHLLQGREREDVQAIDPRPVAEHPLPKAA